MLKATCAQAWLLLRRSAARIASGGTSLYAGHLDQWKDGVLSGWVCDLRDLDRPVDVHLLIDGAVAMKATADGYRHDLFEKGYGTGRHAFRLAVPPEFFDGETHALRVVPAAQEGPLRGSLAAALEARLPAVGRASGLGPRIDALNEQGPSVQISLIMPTFNRGETMEATIRAILRFGAGVSYEIVVVNDGSADDTQERLARLAKEVANLRHKTIDNGGPGRARNVGCGMASGEILLFVGDDTAPIDDNFLRVHLLAHDRDPRVGTAVLGKIRWSEEPRSSPSFVMTHIQGDGQQQFGYAAMEAYRYYDWRHFYCSNVSVKRSLVRDWATDGFSEDFYFAAFEDGEFAYRMGEKHGRFEVWYAPAAVLVHDHRYSVESFLSRQQKAGQMAWLLLEKHPSLRQTLCLDEVGERLRDPVGETGDLPVEHYMGVVQGIKSWAIILEHHHGLGSQNWHTDFLQAVFRVSFLEGYILACEDVNANLGAAYRHVLSAFRSSLSATFFIESLDRGKDAAVL